jgi:hypothetical protein
MVVLTMRCELGIVSRSVSYRVEARLGSPTLPMYPLLLVKFGHALCGI